MYKIQKRIIVLGVLLFFAHASLFAQNKAVDSTIKAPLKFSDFYSDKMKVDVGVINIYSTNNKYFVEINNSMLGREFLLVSRISKGAAEVRNQMAGYGGDEINNMVIKFENAPSNRIFLKKISYSERSVDSLHQMYKAVSNSNLQPVVASFDIKAYSRYNDGVIIDFTDYLNGDNEVFFFSPAKKFELNLGALQADRSFVNSFNSYSANLEIRTTKTFTKVGSVTLTPGMSTLPKTGVATLELNTSIVLLPATPMKTRFVDPRVGFFSVTYTDFDINPQGVKNVGMTKRWRLEPGQEDIEKYKRGELVVPTKPIVFYIDPATPKKWVRYLIQGVNDWQAAFEKAGFKNAIYAREAPTKQEDSTWSLEDARYSAIVYKASSIQNASGPSIVDPRSGEILESHINWYHNIMDVLHYWYLIQASPTDPDARKMIFSDSLMGQLIRFVCAHEVGHTLGLAHNFGSSSTVPVDSLRSETFLTQYGHTPSIMDYARFNYVAQPEDHISKRNLFPRIGDYDKWAIEWGYRLFPEYKNAEDEKPHLNKWVIEKLKNKRLWFGIETNPSDPRCQSEDLGDDAMKANELGIRNLKYVIARLVEWTKTPGENYENLEEMYRQLLNQYYRYIGNVTKNLAGTYVTEKTTEQEGYVFTTVPKKTQKEALRFLNDQLFITPKWILGNDILNRVGMDPVDIMTAIQLKYLNDILSKQTLFNLISAEAQDQKNSFSIVELFSDLKKYIWTELSSKSPIDLYRRNLQKRYISNCVDLVKPPVSPVPSTNGKDFDPSLSDISSAVLSQLKQLRTEIKTAIPLYKDQMSKWHLEDCLDRINEALDKK